VLLKNQWRLGEPDLIVPMDRESVLSMETAEVTREFFLPSGITEAKWVRAADLLPGTPGLVRDAIISIENGPTLALWQPGTESFAAPSGAVFRVAPGATLHLQVHYKRHYDQLQDALSDQSRIGLYFADPPASGHELQAIEATVKKAALVSSGVQILRLTLPRSGRVYGLRPLLDKAYDSVDIVAVAPNGTQTPLLKLRGPRPSWFWRYWLQDSIELAGGSTIEARFTPLVDYSDEMKVSADRFPLQLAVDYVAQ